MYYKMSIYSIKFKSIIISVNNMTYFDASSNSFQFTPNLLISQKWRIFYKKKPKLFFFKIVKNIIFDTQFQHLKIFKHFFFLKI